MAQPGFTPSKRRWPRWGAAGLFAAVCAWIAVSPGCSPDVSSSGNETSDKTIGYYCDQLLPAFCAYAVESCGDDGPVARCIDNNRPICCQGACSRPARLLGDLDACKLTYAGRDAGVDEGGVAFEAVAGRPCEEVLAGLSPAVCHDVVELLAQPPVDQAR